MNTKALGRVEIKDVDQGSITAVFATLGVVDSDGDVTVDGAFEDGAPVRISAYGHASWGGALPVGKGAIRVVGGEALLDGQFFMDTAAGRDTFTVVKELGPMQEWSYGYDAVEFSFGEQDGQRVRFLRKQKVHEVSPVMLGAGVGTRTLTAKAASPLFVARAVEPHTTAVADESWDGYSATKGLALTSRALDLHTVYAWVVGAKSGFALPHHQGVGGAANVRACMSGIGLLNCGKSGVPDPDRAAVYEHLAAHLRDAGREPPELRAADSGDVKFNDELLGGLAGLSALLDSTARVVALRAEKGKELSAVNTEVLGWISDDLTRLKSLLSPAPPAEGETGPADEPPGLGEDDIRTLMAATARVLTI